MQNKNLIEDKAIPFLLYKKPRLSPLVWIKSRFFCPISTTLIVYGKFEERYKDGFTSIRGTYINAYHDVTEITYGEKLYGFPETQQKLVNIIDAQDLTIFLGEERFSLFEGEILSYERNLHMDKGFSERIIHWRSPKDHEIKLHFKRLVSFTVKELFAIEVTMEPISYFGKVTISSNVNGDVENFTDPNDPRVASGHAKRLKVIATKEENGICSVIDETYVSKLQTACASKHTVNVEHTVSHNVYSEHVESIYTFELAQPVTFTKWNAYSDTLRHGAELLEKATSALQAFQRLLLLKKKLPCRFLETC